MVTTVPAARVPSRLTANQIRGFWAAWGGWALDGMDASIYAVVLVPALADLLPRSGIAATPANVGYYGSVLLALFLFGWGLSMVWGPVADRFGRVRALMLTILCYSLFTFLCALVTNIWQLAALRVLCGIGIGGEQPIGGTFVAEEWPEDRRKMGAGYMHTGYYFGFFLAALANYFIGANFGWRWMFALGGAPALLVSWIRLGRRKGLAVYFALMGTSIAFAFGYVFYITPNALPAFFAMVFLLGLGGANFAMYTLWIPEQYTTECRGSAIGFTSSIGRFVGCAMVFLVGAGIAHFKTLGIPVAITATAFVLGLLLLPLGEATRGKPLPV